MMPTMSTSCCNFFGTENRAMMMTNTKRLSIERLYSVSQPARNCARVLRIAEERA